MKPIIKKYKHQIFECISIENEIVEAAFLPEIGGKMIALKDKDTQQQFLLEPQNASKKYMKATYGADFSHFDVSGFDECFPTVEASGPFPDHGEVWSGSWDVSIEDQSLVFSFKGIKADYLFKKRISLFQNTVQMAYSVTNNMKEQFHYIWSAHPLFRINPGVRLILPENVSELFLNWSSDPNVGTYGDTIQWPVADLGGNRNIDLSSMTKHNTGLAIKCFSNVLHDGFVGLYHSAIDRTVSFEFDPHDVPYAGLWLCYGGWPTESPDKHVTIAIEPCSGRPDKLSNAVQRNEHQTIEPGETKTWDMNIGIWPGLKKSSSIHTGAHFRSI